MLYLKKLIKILDKCQFIDMDLVNCNKYYYIKFDKSSYRRQKFCCNCSIYRKFNRNWLQIYKTVIFIVYFTYCTYQVYL